ncbi:MAG: aspartyl protease family protein [Pyrinomonadaceae bacterium]|nr:aspartyl protease family protein [Phycisphaerales bacterium]
MFRTLRFVRAAMLLVALVGVVGGGPSHTQAQHATAIENVKAEREGRPEPVRFPFEFASGKIWIATTVNGKGPYWFALDTGAPPTVIDMDVAREAGLEVKANGTIGGAGEGTTPRGTVSNVTLGFGPFELRRKSMETIALGPRLDWANSRRVGGLIGNDWVIKHVVTIDYANQEVIVHDPETYEYHGDGIIIPTRFGGYTFAIGSITAATKQAGALDHGSAPEQAAQNKPEIREPDAEPIRVKWMIDSGAGLSASLNTHLVNENNLLDMPTTMIEASVGFGLGGEVRHRVCRIPQLRLGEMVIDNPVVTLSQDKAGALAMRLFDGIIGGEVLSRFTVTLDRKRNRMILEPNARYTLPMEYDMAGMSLVGPKRAAAKSEPAKGDDAAEQLRLDIHSPVTGLLRVLRVVTGSPAEEAGVQEGDEILSIDGVAVTIADRDRIRPLLREDGKERTIIFQRNGRTVEITIKLRRLVRGEQEPATPFTA